MITINYKKISNKIIFLAIISLFLVSCGSSNTARNDFNKIVDNIIDQEQPIIAFRSEPTPILVEVKSQKNIKLEKIVNVSIIRPINIVAAIDFADSSLSISPDAGVDLNKKFIVKFNNQPLSSYFEYLENITGYSLELVDNLVYVRSIQSKTWHLQSLSMSVEAITSNTRSEISSDGGAPQISSSSSESSQKWRQILEHVKTIMNSGNAVKVSGPDTNSAKEFTAVVTDNQQLGIISAIGLPAKIRQVDTWLDNLVNASNRQIHLQVQILDVSVNESVGQGINWNLISNQSSQFGIGNNATQAIDGAGRISIGTPVGGLIDLGKNITLDILLEFLASQGKVRINNQPDVTITNGNQAYIGSSNEFSYVTSIKATPDDNGNVVTTSELERTNVGIDMRVTPKILPDGRIAINVLPVISSLTSFTRLSSGAETFQTPNITLQKLATQVITESGKTIHLGGLIASKVSNAAKGLPGGGGVFSFLFDSNQKSLERKEIIILITPTIVR